jgi:alpha-galactosidase
VHPFAQKKENEMKKENGKVSDVKIAYIGGGSRAWARKLMCDLVLEETISGSVALYDINEDAAKDNAIIGNKIAMDKKAKSKWNFYVVNSMEEALTGADFVVLSILPNTFREMHAEVHMPEQLGIYQSVGDTAGFGGYMRAMRTAPIYIEFAKDLKKYCPNAWVINYTNPMTLCTRILYEYFPEIKMFGCCHEVFGAQKVLAKAYAEITGEEEPAREDIKTDVTGINHFTWVTKASYKDVDLFPIFKQVAEKYAEEGFISECAECGYEDEDGEDILSLHDWEEGKEITCPECGAVLELLDAVEELEEINVYEPYDYDYEEPDGNMMDEE